MERTTRALIAALPITLLLLIGADFCRTASAQEDPGSRWLQIGPSAGTIQKILPHRGISNVVFAINNEHLYRSTDSGKHWRLKPMEDVLDVQIHVRTGMIFALTEIPNPKGYYESGSAFYASVDGGDNFKILSQQDFPVGQIRIHPDNPNVMFAWGRRDAYKSMDGGRHWDFVDFPSSEDVYYEASDVLFSPLDPKVVYVGAEIYIDHADYQYVILESRNLGKNWKFTQSASRKGSFSFHQDPSFPERALAYNRDRGIMKLTPLGWTPVTDFGVVQLIADPLRRSRLFAFQGNGYCYDSRLYQSLDEGLTWTPVGKDLHNRISALALLADKSNTLLGGTDGSGLFRRQGTNSWKHSSAGMKEAIVTRIATDKSQSSLFAASSSYASCNRKYSFHVRNVSASSWSNFTSHLSLKSYQSILDVSVDPFNPSHVYVVSGTGYDNYLHDFVQVVVSFDGGRTWTTSLFDQTDSYSFFLTQDPGQSNVVYASGFYEPEDANRLEIGIFKSVDGGLTFQELPLDFTQFSGRAFVRVVIDENDSNVLYFLSATGIFKSLDGGMTMVSLSGASPGGVWTMAQLPGKDSFLLLAKRGIVYRTTNGGRTWKEFSRIDTQKFQLSSDTLLLAADKKGLRFFANSRDHHLYESLDGGMTWNDVTKELGPDIEVFDITDPRNDTFFVATSHGVFQQTSEEK